MNFFLLLRHSENVRVSMQCFARRPFSLYPYREIL